MRTLSLCAGPDGAELAVQVRTLGGGRLLRRVPPVAPTAGRGTRLRTIAGRQHRRGASLVIPG